MVSDPVTSMRFRNRFNTALQRGRRRRLWQALTGGRPYLLSLGEVLAGRPVSRQPPRREQVPLREIRGSAHRSRDYSSDFLPLSAGDEERWVHVAAGLEETGLPAVRLLRYRGDYFVEDGHHRVSILKNLGARTIEAEVIELHDLPPVVPAAPFVAEPPPCVAPC